MDWLESGTSSAPDHALSPLINNSKSVKDWVKPTELAGINFWEFYFSRLEKTKIVKYSLSKSLRWSAITSC